MSLFNGDRLDPNIEPLSCSACRSDRTDADRYNFYYVAFYWIMLFVFSVSMIILIIVGGVWGTFWYYMKAMELFVSALGWLAG